MLFTNKNCSHNDNNSLIVDGITINRQASLKLLGIHIDDKLTWNEHIKVIKSIISSATNYS